MNRRERRAAATKTRSKVQRTEMVPLDKLHIDPDQARLVCETYPKKLRLLVAEMSGQGATEFHALAMLVCAAGDVAWDQGGEPGCFEQAAALIMAATAKTMGLPWPQRSPRADWPEPADRNCDHLIRLREFVAEMRGLMGPLDAFDTLMAHAADIALTLNFPPSRLEAIGREHMALLAQSAVNESSN
jgi:hypothetical protein